MLSCGCAECECECEGRRRCEQLAQAVRVEEWQTGGCTLHAERVEAAQRVSEVLPPLAVRRRMQQGHQHHEHSEQCAEQRGGGAASAP